MKTKINTEDHPEVFAAIRELEVDNPVTEAERANHALLSRIGGERATQGPGNKIVYTGGKTHVVWQDSYQERYFARIRSFDHEKNRWERGEVLMEGVDEHSRPVIAVAEDGYLHVVMGGHNTPLQYRRSLSPNDTSEWSPTVTFGAGTYPVLLAGNGGRLILTARNSEQDGLGVWVRERGGIWEFKTHIFLRDENYSKYSAFLNGLAWGPGKETLHFSTGLFLSHDSEPGEHFRHASGIYQAIGYLYSPDGGENWERCDGNAVPLPSTLNTLELLIEGKGKYPKAGITFGGIAVNSEDKPILAFTRHNPTPGEVILYTLGENRKWIALMGLNDAVRKKWPGFGLLTVRLSMTSDDVLCAVGTLVPLEHEKANWNPGVFGLPDYWLREVQDMHRVVYFESADGGVTFNPIDLVPDPRSGTGQHMPSIERREGFNTIDTMRARVIYTEGNSDYPPDGVTYQNNVYFVS